VLLNGASDVDAQVDALMKLPGIGPWTAQYVAMRALHWPDAFPGTDLLVLRAAGMRPAQLLARAQGWRPWRAYATHYLWQSLGVLP
jgi:AraC family transcriptional regulator of adaptative response / DNA-3-methyladenine glycosylase II